MRHNYLLLLGAVVAMGMATDLLGQNAPAKRLITTKNAGEVAPMARFHQDSPVREGLRGGIANDNCADAQVLTVNAAGACPAAGVPGNNFGANNDGGAPACDSSIDGFEDVWYAFNSGSYTSVTIAVEVGDIEDLIVEVLQGACGGTSIQCDYTQLSYTIPVTPNTDYRIRIASNLDFGAGGTFTICLTGAGGGSAPPNDLCTGAVVQNLAVGSTVTFSGDNTGATVLAGTSFVVVWEAFTTTECATIVLDYCVPGSEFDDFLINLVTNCPDVLTGVLTGVNDACTLTFAELPAGTYYIPVMVDPASTPIGAYSLSATAIACPTGYCTAGATSTQFEKIGNVTYANINNSSTSTAGYEDFTAIVGNVVAGATNNITVTITGPYDEDVVLVWIDLDQSESFEPNELMYTSPMGVGPHTGAITIPLTAATGQTRMRVRLHDSLNGPNATPCGTSTYGQVEDYTLSISGGVQCDAVAGTLSGGANVCFEGDPVTLTATPSGNAVVPAGFETVYVLTQGAGLVIINAGAAPSFAVNALGTYTIHTLVYDPSTLDLSIVEFGVTTGFEVNGLLLQGGGSICASLDVAGAAFGVVVCGNYCDAGADGTGLGLEERIVNVTFAGINNNSPNVTPVAPAYSDFTAVVGTVEVGQSYPIAVDVNRNGANTSYNTNQVLVWIDYNADGDFEDAGELVFESTIESIDVFTGSVTIPAGATLGGTRMRVRLHDTHDGSAYTNNFNNTPCGIASYGEVEDYTIIIDGSSSIEETLSNGFTIYPNPGDGHLNILYAGVDGRVAMEVFDMTGRILYSDVRMLNNGERSEVALAGRLSAGSYILRLTNDQGSLEQRFMVR